MEEQKRLTMEGSMKLQEGISMVFSKWWALQMAVENGWGGPHSRDKALNFASRAFDFFNLANHKEPLYIDDLERLLEEGMDSFNTTVDDGSIEQVAEKLMIMHEECLEGNYQSIERLREVKPMPISRARQVENDSDDEDDESIGNDEESNMMVDTPGSLTNLNPPQITKHASTTQQMAQPDEDGWVTVSSKKNRGRRN